MPVLRSCRIMTCCCPGVVLPAGAQSSSVFALAYDPFNQFYMSGGDGVPVAIWSADGRLQQQ